MSSRRAAPAIGLLVALASPVWAQSGKPTLEMEAVGEVQIAPDGHVSDYRLGNQGALPADIAQLVDRNVRAWQFEPVLVDGGAVVAKTALRIKLKAEPLGGGDHYTVQVIQVSFGEPTRSSQNKPPRYPEAAVSARLGAKVLLALRLDETGQVVDVQPYQTSLDARARSESDAERWRRSFEKASIAAAKTWHFDLTEKINGRPIGTIALLPVEYSVGTSVKDAVGEGKWKAFIEGPVHPVAWMQKQSSGSNEKEIAALGDGQAMSLDSRFHLKNAVIGKSL